MDPVLYRAAAEGKLEAFEHIVDPLDCFKTLGNNTILHIHATALIQESESTTAFVNAILYKCPSLLWGANTKGDTPLHIAARRSNFPYSANDAGETPLYLAIERNFQDVARKIFETCASPSYDGPLGRTALHAAVIQHNTEIIEELLKRFGDISKKEDQNGWTPIHFAAYLDSTISAELLLGADRQVAHMKNSAGMTALHIAAYRGNRSVMETIISKCPDCCELVDNRGWNVLHFAINGKGGKDIVGVILKDSSLSNLLNEEDFDGNTPFHHQFKSKDIDHADLMDHPRVDKMAFNKQNHTGGDVALLGAKIFPEIKKFNSKDIDREDVMDLVEMALSKEKLTDSDVALLSAKLYSFPEIKKLHYIEHVLRDFGQARRVITDEVEKLEESLDALKRLENAKQEEIEKTTRAAQKAIKEKEKESKNEIDKAAGAHLVAAALITTVTFTAGITVPGGFESGDDSHPGSAVLTRSAAFIAFVISNDLSMLSSTCAVLIHLFVPTLGKLEQSLEFLEVARLLIFLAMGGMVLAFVTGSYAVLTPSLLLAISSCIIGLFFFPLLFLIFKKVMKYGHDQ
ncbi:hypothetical protein CJ030_MR4G024556 [Morella rubra]|uniref:PGG domain-containing protein n=1 Tax=Morella rubra TaxID=262757 RepID=A0A6A1VT49_9ROSI|nr:hypothetical protein CJ030_MR4G024553 [Morella rubra]KAB1216003.1 hypothetical protein CJ030_MR4G024556 [Morella rubra]